MPISPCLSLRNLTGIAVRLSFTLVTCFGSGFKFPFHVSPQVVRQDHVTLYSLWTSTLIPSFVVPRLLQKLAFTGMPLITQDTA